MTKWCTRYVYIPLGGSKGSTLSTCLNVGAVFTVTALWHNYDIQFALWGIMLSAFIAVEMVRMLQEGIIDWLQLVSGCNTSTVKSAVARLHNQDEITLRRLSNVVVKSTSVKTTAGVRFRMVLSNYHCVV